MGCWPLLSDGMLPFLALSFFFRQHSKISIYVNFCGRCGCHSIISVHRNSFRGRGDSPAWRLGSRSGKRVCLLNKTIVTIQHPHNSHTFLAAAKVAATIQERDCMKQTTLLMEWAFKHGDQVVLT
jgi:hypothetical protein